MKSAAIGFLKVIAIALTLALLAWSGTFLYWHFKIMHGIRVLQNSSPKVQEAYSSLRAAGCRALPYLVREMNPSSTPEFSREAILLLAAPTSQAAEFRGESFSASMDLLQKCMLYEQDTSEIREQKCDQLRQWWKENGSRYYRWWRVWSGRCR